ncbi:hypothetical protein BDY24DRAFT_386501 [Mrakia frigida]|uniref:uncharacterized protein n=1 Tax=Mrakia frigida TaxID=29902 RepID=UPI003FCC0726
MSLLSPFLLKSTTSVAARLSARSTSVAGRRASVLPSSSRGFSSSFVSRNPSDEEKAKLQAEYDKHRTESASAPSHVAVDESFEFKYSGKELGEDLGHKTDGSGHGRHNKRTLASMSMEGKVVVITGAARGLGNMAARTFVECGSNKVAIIDLSEDDSKRAATEMTDWFVGQGEVKAGELDAVGYGCNVADEEAVKKVFADIKARWGRIDILVTAAGIVENFGVLDYPADRMNKLWGVNVNGTYFCAREAAKIMIETNTKGNVLMFASMSAGVVNVPQVQAPYNASKAAVRHLGASMAVELATKNVRVNCISPGYILTSLTKTILDKDPVLRDTWVGLTPQARLGEPEDLKGAIVYLTSDSASYTTGANLIVDGGYSLV